MKKSHFTEEQIAHVLRQAEAGVPVAEQTFYRRKKYGSMGGAELRRLR